MDPRISPKIIMVSLVILLIICGSWGLAQLVIAQTMDTEKSYERGKNLFYEGQFCPAIQPLKNAISRVEQPLSPLVFYRDPAYPFYFAALQAVNSERFRPYDEHTQCPPYVPDTLDDEVKDNYLKAEIWGGANSVGGLRRELCQHSYQYYLALIAVLKRRGLSVGDRNDCATTTSIPTVETLTLTPPALPSRIPQDATVRPDLATPTSAAITHVLTPAPTPTPTPTPASAPTPIPIATRSVSIIRVPRGECSSDENNIAAIDQADSRLQIIGTAAVSNPKSQEDAFDYFELWVKRAQDDSGSYGRIAQSRESKKGSPLITWDWKSRGLKSGDSINLRLWVYRKNGQHSDPGCIIEFNIP